MRRVGEVFASWAVVQLCIVGLFIAALLIADGLGLIEVAW